MTQEKKDILNSYAQLKIEAKSIEEKLNELNTQVLDIMNEDGLEEIEISGCGKLSFGSRRKWSYTPDITAREEALKEEKKTQERTGEAKYTENKYVLFTSIKEK